MNEQTNEPDELDALANIIEQLEQFDDATQTRLLRYLAERYIGDRR